MIEEQHLEDSYFILQTNAQFTIDFFQLQPCTYIDTHVCVFTCIYVQNR